MVASPTAPPGISGGRGKAWGFLTEVCPWVGIWQDGGREQLSAATLGLLSEWAYVGSRLQPSLLALGKASGSLPAPHCGSPNENRTPRLR